MKAVFFCDVCGKVASTLNSMVTFFVDPTASTLPMPWLADVHVTCSPECMRRSERRAHVAAMTSERQIMSDLLFPSRRGGHRAASCLDKPFADIAAKMKLPFPLTPRAMRRTFQDLARATGIHDTVTRSISGHATAEMQAHYSTAAAEEQRRAIGQISDLVGNSSASVNTSKKRAGKMAGRKQ